MAVNPKVASFLGSKVSDLKGRVAIITGSTRGIGRECALALAKVGVNIVVAAKSTEEKPGLPGTIYSVAEECKKLGVSALPCKMDMRDDKSVEECVNSTVERFGRIDIVINNASALWWHTIEDTPVNKYDLITSINSRGSFTLTKHAFPHMRKGGFGRVINMSPPLQTDYKAFKGMTAYNISKFGMSMVALGAAAEGEDFNVTGNTLWPATIIESQASKNFKMGNQKMWRKASILSDSVLLLCCSPHLTGGQFIDDELLSQECGFKLSGPDFATYQMVPGKEPPRALAAKASSALSSGSFKRGDVRKVTQDAKL